MPTGIDNNALIKAMCSLPVPDAIDRWASKPWNLFCNLLIMSCFNSVSGFVVSTFIISDAFAGS